jgi:hypothetical protein
LINHLRGRPVGGENSTILKLRKKKNWAEIKIEGAFT